MRLLYCECGVHPGPIASAGIVRCNLGISLRAKKGAVEREDARSCVASGVARAD
jgi:hypothetical protein